MKLNCITIDDEPLALGLINSFIDQIPFLNLVHTFNSSADIISKVQELEFHVLFLDISMPGLNGIEVARLVNELPLAFRPKIIFVTAYNQFAVESYQVEALDYLLKPFEYEDLLASATKALHYFESLPDFLASQMIQEESLFVRSDYQQVKINWCDIKFIQGLKDYVVIHLKNTDKSIVTLATMKSLEEKLPQKKFRRIQRSYIVALDAVTSIATNTLWIDEIEISIGEQYKKSIHGIFKKL